MKNVSRRSFVSSTVGGMAALSVLATLTTPAEAELVWKASEWKQLIFEMNPVARHYRFVKGQAGLGAVPANEVINGPSIAAL